MKINISLRQESRGAEVRVLAAAAVVFRQKTKHEGEGGEHRSSLI